MLQYDKIDVSEEIIANETTGSRECIIFHYWYFIQIHFRFYTKVYNECHDLMQKAMSINNFLIVSVKENAYRTYCWHMSKDEVLNLFLKMLILDVFYEKRCS